MRKEIRIFGVILGGDAVTYTINCAERYRRDNLLGVTYR